MEKGLKRIDLFLLKAKEIIDYATIVGIFYILLYQIDALRKICKAICEYVVKWYIPIEIAAIKDIYSFFEGIFRVIIVISIICAIVSMLFKFANDKRLKNVTGKGRFEECLFRYLHDSTVPRCFLITGQWGSGKSYEVNHFFDKYYRYTQTQVYRISCFGLSSRRELIDEINNTIEQKDKSFYAQIIKVLQYLPVIGEAINKFLKKSYEYDSIEKDSIFIFDDFERLTSQAITNEYSGVIYKQSPAFLRGVTRGNNQLRLFEEIKNEFGNVAEAFSKIDNSMNKYLIKEDYDKYVAIIGFINELIEVYQMKVIVICNSDILSKKFIHDVLRSKLNCIEYKKVITEDMRLSIIDDIIRTRVVDDIEKQECIKQYLNLVKENIESFSLDSNFKNLRLFSGLLDAFIDTVVLFDSDVLTIEFMNSLMNSIMIVHLSFYSNCITHFNSYVNGANIEFLIQMVGGPLRAINLIRVNGNCEEIKWIETRVSGYWIMNLSVPEDIKDIFEEWSNYKFSRLEEQILLEPQSFLKESEYDLIHLFFYLKQHDEEMNGKWNFRPYIENALVNYDLNKIEVVEKILDNMGQIFNGMIDNEFQNTLFDVLSSGGAAGKVMGGRYIHAEYNRFLEKTAVGTERGEE